MKRRIFTLLQGPILWYPAALIAALIVLAMIAALPPGDRFIYPLRDLYLRLAGIAYLPTAVVLVACFASFLPLFISWSISKMDGQGEVGRDLPNMRAFFALTLAAFLGFAQFGDTLRERDLLDTSEDDAHTYLLFRQDSLTGSDQYLLFECDTLQVLCEQVYIHFGAISGWTPEVSLRPGEDGAGVTVVNGGRLLYTHPPP